MPSDIPYWKRRKLKDFRRKEGVRGLPKDVFLIVCEGDKTEPNYFKGFRLPRDIMTVHGIGCNTESLVVEAIKKIQEAAFYGYKYDQVWCVFDRDSFPEENFNNAISLAKRKGFKIAYSNQAFELWYLLHFDYVNTSINRNEYKRRLSRKLGRTYCKNSKEMYNLLIEKQQVAIRNANRLLNSYPNLNPSHDDPSTTVHLLVSELNKFLQR